MEDKKRAMLSDVSSSYCHAVAAQYRESMKKNKKNDRIPSPTRKDGKERYEETGK